MADSGGLINLGDLGKPVDTLIQKIASAVGILYEPRRIVNNAKAEAAANLLAEQSRIDVTSLKERALQRLNEQEIRKQRNMESITAQAIPMLAENPQVSQLDEDWLAHFYKRCETVSNGKMQILWAKLLAGEASAPGTFSKRTLDLVESMDKSDAVLFTNLCQFVWTIEGEPHLAIFNYKREVFGQSGINFATISHMVSIGLISFSGERRYSLEKLGTSCSASYFGKEHVLKFPSSYSPQQGGELQVGSVRFTQIGRELCLIAGAAANAAYYRLSMNEWAMQGIWTK